MSNNNYNSGFVNVSNITPSNTKILPTIVSKNLVKVIKNLNILLMGATDLTGTSSLGLAYDLNNYNCEEDFLYKFRVEDIKEGRSVTIRGVRLIYRNLGQVVLEVGVEVFCKENNTFNYVGEVQQLGTVIPDNKLYTVNYNLTNTGERPQIVLYRKALQGPLALTSITMYGEGIEGDPV